jgi:Rod binding domain-containing protein
MEVTGLPSVPLMLPADDPALLAAQAQSGHGPDNQAVATAFESMFTTLLVKQMRQTLEPDTMFGGDRGEVLGGLFDFYLGQHLAQTGMLGIGTMIRKQLEARKTHEPTPTVAPGQALPGSGPARRSKP